MLTTVIIIAGFLTFAICEALIVVGKYRTRKTQRAVRAYAHAHVPLGDYSDARYPKPWLDE